MKINRAKDAPANLIASERFRGNIAGLKQSHNNTEMAMTIYQQTEGSLNEISDMLIRLKQLSVHASNEAVNDDAMLAADQQEAENLLGSITRVIQNTVYNGKSLLDGSQGANGTTVGDNLRFVSADVSTNGSPEEGFPVDITQVATRAQKAGHIPLTVENISDGIFVLVSEGGRNADSNKNKYSVADIF
jgi:flagellin